MSKEDLLFAIGIASLLASAYVMKLVTAKEREEKAQKTTPGHEYPEWLNGEEWRRPTLNPDLK